MIQECWALTITETWQISRHLLECTWVFPKTGVLQNGWLIMKNSIKMNDLGVPLFFGNTHMPHHLYNALII